MTARGIYVRPMVFKIKIEDSIFRTKCRTPQCAVWRMLAKWLRETNGGTYGFRQGGKPLTIKIWKEEL